MKISTLKILPVILLTIALQGCDIFDAAENVKFDVDLPLEFSVNEQDRNPNGKDYTNTRTLNILDNADVAKYKDKVKDVKLNSISYVVSDYQSDGSSTFTNGSLSSSGTKLAGAASVNLQDAGEHDLTDVNTTGFEALAGQLKNNKQADVTASGRLSYTPVACKITAYFHVTVTAGALK